MPGGLIVTDPAQAGAQNVFLIKLQAQALPLAILFV